jgi:hypothetical protein
MAWHLTGDVAEYAAQARGFLRERAAENTVILTVLEALRAGGPDAIGDGPPLFGWWREPGGAVGAAFMHTPPFGVALTAMPPAAAAALAEALASRGRALRSVDGGEGAAEAFA